MPLTKHALKRNHSTSHAHQIPLSIQRWNNVSLDLLVQIIDVRELKQETVARMMIASATDVPRGNASRS
jgi:hypothetical protein